MQGAGCRVEDLSTTGLFLPISSMRRAENAPEVFSYRIRIIRFSVTG